MSDRAIDRQTFPCPQRAYVRTYVRACVRAGSLGITKPGVRTYVRACWLSWRHEARTCARQVDLLIKSAHPRNPTPCALPFPTLSPPRLCHYFCLLYSLSCLLALNSNFYVLLLGRVAGGMATSLLFSTFESWMIAEHNRQVCRRRWLSTLPLSPAFVAPGFAFAHANARFTFSGLPKRVAATDLFCRNLWQRRGRVHRQCSR